MNAAESVVLRNKSLRKEMIVFFSAEKTRRRRSPIGVIAPASRDGR